MLFFSGKKEKKETTLRWGLIGIKNEFVVDETEIAAIEWMNFMQYEKLQNFPTYIEKKSTKQKHLSEKEKTTLQFQYLNNRLYPDKKIIKSLPYYKLIYSTSNKKLYDFRNGLNWPIALSLDSIVVDSLRSVYGEKGFNKMLLLPIVGVTYEQALLFCKWRNEYENLRYDYVVKVNEYSDDMHEFYTFKLPSREEHKRYNYNQDSINYSKKKPFSNYNYKNCMKYKKDKYPYSNYGKEAVTPWHNYSDNIKYSRHNLLCGIDHVQGNVAEMSDVKDVSLGGSFMHPAIKSYTNQTIQYTKPEMWLGFRCIGHKLETD